MLGLQVEKEVSVIEIEKRRGGRKREKRWGGGGGGVGEEEEEGREGEGIKSKAWAVYHLGRSTPGSPCEGEWSWK